MQHQPIASKKNLTDNYFVSNDSFWEKSYGSFLNNLRSTTEKVLLINDFLDIERKKSILEYGSSYGYLLGVLSQVNSEHVLYGVDISNHACTKAKKYLIGDMSRIFNISCVEKIPLKSESLGLIVSFDMVEHLKNRIQFKKMAKESYRLLKHGGILIISTINSSAQSKVFLEFWEKVGFIMVSRTPMLCQKRQF